MTRFDKLVWAASLAAPVAGWVLLLGFGVFVALAALRYELLSPASAAWLSALPVLLWLAGHLAVRFHSLRRGPFTRDEAAELVFRLNRGRGFSHWRELMRRRGHGWYGGRSHSGERPRYD